MAKTVTIPHALSLVHSGDYIATACAGGEAREFLTHLHTIAHRVTGVTVSTCIPMAAYQFSADPAYRGSFTTECWFYSPALRRGKAGDVTYIPSHLHQIARNRLDYRAPDIYVGLASVPDKHGYVSLAISNIYEKRMLEAAKTVILEINPNAPRTHGDLQVHVNDVDHLVEVDYPIPELPDPPLNDRDLAIGKLIAAMVQDGDCIQLGIGGIPNAVAASLMDKKDLGVHTEMLTTGMMQLVKAGVITGKRKRNHPGKLVAAFAMGTRELYEFIDDNPAVAILDGSYVADPTVIAQNDNQFSVNTTIEVDLTGQCCSESVGFTHISGTGGQADTVIGAQKSRGGRSVIALYSTAMAKDPATGQRTEVSKIVCQLQPGAAVSLSRNDLDWLVTEYGAVRLRGTSLAERARRIISVAHPKFRDRLTCQAIACGLLPG